MFKSKRDFEAEFLIMRSSSPEFKNLHHLYVLFLVFVHSISGYPIIKYKIDEYSKNLCIKIIWTINFRLFKINHYINESQFQEDYNIVFRDIKHLILLINQKYEKAFNDDIIKNEPNYANTIILNNDSIVVFSIPTHITDKAYYRLKKNLEEQLKSKILLLEDGLTITDLINNIPPVKKDNSHDNN